MTVFNVIFKPGLPDFAEFALSKKVLQDRLEFVPQEEFNVHFMSWRSEKDLRRRRARGKQRKLSVEETSKRLLSVYCYGSNWTIWVYPVRRERLEQVRTVLIEQGLNELKRWLRENQMLSDPDSTDYDRPHDFQIECDEQNLTLGSWRTKNKTSIRAASIAKP